jgi:predicted nucleotidyltransferase
MNDPSKPSYLSLPIPHFLDAFKLVDEVMRENAIPYYLIGRTAADLLHLEEDIDPFEMPEKWKEVDFAMKVSSLEVCERIKAQLLNKGFKATKKPFNLRHPVYNVATELVPFGEIEAAAPRDPAIENITAKSLGLREALEQSTLVLLDDKLVAEVPPLHGLAMLDLISWSERPATRTTDLDHFWWIFIN